MEKAGRWAIETRDFREFSEGRKEIIRPLRLTKKVRIEGPDFFGFPAWIEFSPTNLKGWIWRYSKGKLPIAITPELFSYRFRRVALVHKREIKKVEFIEHIGPLRWLGLDNVVIESSPWPPFHGRPLELWEELNKPGLLEESDGEFEWKKPRRESIGFCKRGLEMGCTKISPRKEPGLRINILCRYPGIGSEELEFNFPEDHRLLKVALEAHTLGWPPWTYHLSRLSSLIGWPHHGHVTWLKELSKDETLRLILLHRLADILGLIAFASPNGLLSADVYSHISGHKADVEAIKFLVL